jgi:hypothetical protein
MTTLKSLVLDPDCMDYGVVDQIFQKEQKSQRTLTVWEKHRLDVVTIQNAAADGTTKGVATFNSTQFDDASGVITLDTIDGGTYA